MTGKPCDKIKIEDHVIDRLNEDIQCKVFHKNENIKGKKMALFSILRHKHQGQSVILDTVGLNYKKVTWPFKAWKKILKILS